MLVSLFFGEEEEGMRPYFTLLYFTLVTMWVE